MPSQRALIGPILERYERRGLKIVGMRLLHLDRDLAERHYGIHRGKPFFEALVSYITSAPVVVAALEGPDAVAVVRRSMAPPIQLKLSPVQFVVTTALRSAEICAWLGSEESAEFELGLYFDADDIVAYRRSTDAWILEE